MDTKKFLLVADDDPLLLQTYSIVLEDAGFASVCVDSADAAERVLSESGRDVLALITDVSLGPGQRTGWQLAVRARELRSDLPVIYLTGAAPEEASANRVPDSGLLAKPFRPERLVTLVRAAI